MGWEEPEKIRMNHYQLIEYAQGLPFRIHNITRAEIMDEAGNQKNMLEHWHRELEIVFTHEGHAVHYMDGIRHQASPGKLFIVNSESIHKVISDIQIPASVDVVATVLVVNYEFLQGLFQNFSTRYFVAEAAGYGDEIARVMNIFRESADREIENEYEQLRLRGLMLELLSYLCRDSLYYKEQIFPINNQKNLERLRGIMTYVGEHYREAVKQSEVAEKFYFTKEYFSRFFKKNTGMTFKEYLTRVRVNAAKEELLHTQGSILDVALDNGFTDARGLIAAFKSVYGDTPSHYRKTQQAERQQCKFP